MMLYERIMEAGAYYGPKPNRFLTENLEQLPKGKILCVSDGSESSGVYLAKQGYEVTVVNSSLANLTQINRLASVNAVDITEIHQDFAQYEIGNNCWDGVVYLSHEEQDISITRVLSQCWMGLREGGVMLIDTFVSLSNVQVEHQGGYQFSREDWLEAFRQFSRLNISRFSEKESYRSFGDCETGTSVQVIGRLD